MPSICKNNCRHEKKASKWTYISGLKMCTICQVGMDSNMSRCYCCGAPLRVGPQTNRSRKKRVENAVRL